MPDLFSPIPVGNRDSFPKEMLPSERECRGVWDYGLYAQAPGKSPCFLGPVYTYPELRNWDDARFAARREANALLIEFEPLCPGLIIFLVDLRTGKRVQRWQRRA